MKIYGHKFKFRLFNKMLLNFRIKSPVEKQQDFLICEGNDYSAEEAEFS